MQWARSSYVHLHTWEKDEKLLRAILRGGNGMASCLRQHRERTFSVNVAGDLKMKHTFSGSVLSSTGSSAGAP